MASWARQIALPYLFRTLVTKDHGVKFNKYLASPPYVPMNTNINPPALVKNVWMPLQDQGATDSVLDVFENCHNIRHMALTNVCFVKLICATTASGYIFGSVKKVITRPALANDRDLHLTVLGANTFNWACHGYWQTSRSDLLCSIVSPTYAWKPPTPIRRDTNSTISADYPTSPCLIIALFNTKRKNWTSSSNCVI